MRKLLFCGAAAVVYLCTAGAAMTAGTALAGGLDEREGSLKDTYVPEPVPLWSGCYIGAGVGGAWSDDNDFGDLKKRGIHADSKEEAYEKHKSADKSGEYWDSVEKKHFKFDDDTDDSTMFGGVLAGCNWERDYFVYGVEGDIGFGNDINYLASLRGRIGAAWDSSLIYLTAGVAFIGLDRDFNLWHEHSYSWDLGSYSKEFDRRFDESSDETGWVIGAGYERFLGTNATFGVEGLYYMFDNDDKSHEWIDEDHFFYRPHKFDRDIDNDVFVLRARLTYYLRRQPEPLK